MKNLKTSMNASHTNSLKSLERKHTNATRRLAKGMDQKIKDTDSMLRININESSRMNNSASNSILESVPPTSGGKNIFATKLIEDIHEAVAAETLNCKPVEGADMPIRQVRYGRGGELHLVQDLEAMPTAPEKEEGQHDHLEDVMGDLYNMFHNPKGFKNKDSGHNYIIEQDIQSINAPIDPRFDPAEIQIPRSQKVGSAAELKKMSKRKQKNGNGLDPNSNIFESKVDLDPNLTNKQKQKTIDLMIKMLGAQIEDAKDEAQGVNELFQEVDVKIRNFNKELEQEEVQVILDDIKRKKNLLDKDMKDSMADAELIKHRRDPFIEDILVDNEMLLAQVDTFVGRRNNDSDSDDIS